MLRVAVIKLSILTNYPEITQLSIDQIAISNLKT